MNTSILTKYIVPEKTYLIAIAQKYNASCGSIVEIGDNGSVEEILSKRYKVIKTENILTRDMYYSQIRDKNNTFEKVYYNEYTYITNLNIPNTAYTLYLMEYTHVICDRLSFPNLSKYHLSVNINQKIIKIKEIELIIENNNIFIKFKNSDMNIVCEIIDILVKLL